ncbi:MAG TPA: O-antigen ligase family protein [Gaiellaceae bacterium]|nr:O-antigen ligase family protein [Gaiellaceae bacterium]
MASYTQPPAARRGVPLALALFGALALLVTVPLGPRAMVGGGILLLLASLLALRDVSVPVFTWPNMAATLILLVWFVPIKTYSLPVDLPFNLEPYRLFLLALIVAWLVGFAGRQSRLSADGHAYPIILLAAVLFTTQIVNFDEVNAGSTEPEALKSLSYFLSFIIVFLLITSTIDSVRALDKLVRVLVAGAGVVALAAIYDSRFTYNVFEHLHEWIPLLEYHPREVDQARGGLLRVYGSAQHPIALSVALLMAVPLGIYLAGRAATVVRSRLWLAVAVVCAAGALATVSRTTVVMIVAMVLVGLWLRGRQLARFWPILLLLPFVVHFLAPGAMGGIYKAFFPKEGLVTSLEGRAGETGSGRFADLEPGFELWIQSPLVGTGIGEQTIPSDLPPGASADPGTPDLIFDNQYMNTIVTTGMLGLVAVAWFVWGGVVKLARAARRRIGQPSDLLAACCIAAAGFGASMFLFDAFYFVQCTLFFFMVVAIGLRMRALSSPSPSRELRAL